MIRIVIEDKRESIFYAVALGCVLLLAVGVTLMYWTEHDLRDISEAGDGEPVTVFGAAEEMQPMRSRGAGRDTPGKAISLTDSFSEKETDTRSLWFFGTIVCTLIVLFILTFRYYSHREVKEAEDRWRRAMRNFMARMEEERVHSEDEKLLPDTIWSRILKGEEIETSGMERIAINNRRNT
ncbi:MAG: hypothetical protein JSV84_16105 [Gemmatimonadota bacterium]|nr:MAG: hypothetical protein JSV84_16105 [Gemmatimonadota bacterium]